MDTKLRQVGNAFTMIGYFVLIHVNPVLGSSLKIFGFTLVLPFVFRTKMYDLLAVAGFFMSMDISNIIKHLSN